MAAMTSCENACERENPRNEVTLSSLVKLVIYDRRRQNVQN